ncbi:MAG: KH domain-containing protein [Nostocaceae cyanobacterium]|nr:KH domain-containing protein [Nostocaceae cyanobacterium]
MFLNSSVPQPPLNAVSTTTAIPDYIGLVQFLMQPFLESPKSLSVDCEISSSTKAWIRVAFADADKGRVFGRGGRNIQAIRTVIAAAAQAHGSSAYLDIYGSSAQGREGTFDEEEDRRESTSPPRASVANIPRPVTKPRTRTV